MWIGVKQIFNDEISTDDLKQQARPANGEIGDGGSNTASENKLTECSDGFCYKYDTNENRQTDGLEVLSSQSRNKGKYSELHRHHGQYLGGRHTCQ